MSKIPKPKPPTKIKKSAPPPVKKVAPKTNYQLTTLGTNNRGKKIIVSGITGMGKTTLCTLAPNPAFLSLDGGADEIKHPVTGEKLQGINTTSFEETRNILQSNVFDSIDTVVIDHATELQRLALPYVFSTIPASQSRGKVENAKNIEDYGYHKGYRHWYDTMCLILSDCDRWIRAGKNVIIITQESITRWTQSGSEDFVMCGPELYHDKTVSILTAYMSWADHIFRIGYANLTVEDGKANPVKERAVFVHPDATFFAKSRTIPVEYDVVAFENVKDDSIWRLLFGEN